MNIYKVGECQIARVVSLTDIYEARLAIWKAAKAMKKQVGRYPTHIWFPSTGADRLGYLKGFIENNGASVVSGDGSFVVPHDQIWIGYSRSDQPQIELKNWLRRPSLKPEEVRYADSPRKRHSVERKNITVIQLGMFQEASHPIPHIKDHPGIRTINHGR